MARYLIKKSLFFLCSLFLVISLTFFLMHLVPGDPFAQENPIPQEITEALFKHYGLDQPWYVQYGKYLKGVLTCDLGPSFKYEGRKVSSIILESFPFSFTLGLSALCLSLFLGFLLGTLGAFFHNRSADRTITVISVLGISLPNFILATFLQYILAMKMGWFPVARWGSFAHMVLPVLALSAHPTAYIARLTRSSMIEIMQMDFVLTAKAKGLAPIRIAWHYVLRNALLPVVTYLGPLSVSILTGSFIIEKIFGIPGLGQWLIHSIINRDYTTIMGITIFYSCFLMSIIFLLDLTYNLIDPRIKSETLK